MDGIKSFKLCGFCADFVRKCAEMMCGNHFRTIFLCENQRQSIPLHH